MSHHHWHGGVRRALLPDLKLPHITAPQDAGLLAEHHKLAGPPRDREVEDGVCCG
jgi:hypothetical protein